MRYLLMMLLMAFGIMSTSAQQSESSIEKQVKLRYHIIIPMEGDVKMEICPIIYTFDEVMVQMSDYTTEYEDKPIMQVNTVVDYDIPEDGLLLTEYGSSDMAINVYTDIRTDTINYMRTETRFGTVLSTSDKALAHAMFVNEKLRSN